jgi:hypothetical protein
MTASSAAKRATPDPVWSRRTHIAQAAISTVVLMAAGTELVRIVGAGNPASGYIALLAGVTGSFVDYRRPALGLVLVAAAPLLATALGWDPLVTWTIAVFSALVFTLRGLSGTLVAVTVGGQLRRGRAFSVDVHRLTKKRVEYIVIYHDHSQNCCRQSERVESDTKAIRRNTSRFTRLSNNR